VCVFFLSFFSSLSVKKIQMLKKALGEISAISFELNLNHYNPNSTDMLEKSMKIIKISIRPAPKTSLQGDRTSGILMS